DLDRGAGRNRRGVEWKELRKRSFRSRGDRFHQLYRGLIRRAADIAGADVMIISEDAGEISIRLNPARPIFRRPRTRLILLQRQSRIGTRRWWRHFAEIVVDV